MELKDAIPHYNSGPILLMNAPEGEPSWLLMQAYKVYYLGRKDGVHYLFFRGGAGDTGPAGSHIVAVKSYTYVGDAIALNTVSGDRYILDAGGTPREMAVWAENKAVEDADPALYESREEGAREAAIDLTPLRKP